VRCYFAGNLGQFARTPFGVRGKVFLSSSSVLTKVLRSGTSFTSSSLKV